MDRGLRAAGEPKLSADDRRLLLAQWVSVAWESLCRDKYLIRQSFVQTGFLVARDGSENHLIKMAGIENYDVPLPKEPEE